MIVDADLSQIEWRMVAELTRDPVMIEEILGGQDQHAYSCTQLMELPLTKDNRTDAKIFNFRAIYANQQTAAFAYFMDPKMPAFSKKKWEAVITGFFEKYSGMVKAHSDWVTEVRTTRHWQGPTGRIWTFPKHMQRGVMDYKVTQIYNYPVQGTSAELIKLAAIHIYAQLMKYNMESKMVNTVHDSLIFDAPENEVQNLGEIAITVFRDLPKIVKDYFNWEMVVPIDGEVEFGPSWGEMEELKFS